MDPLRWTTLLKGGDKHVPILAESKEEQALGEV